MRKTPKSGSHREIQMPFTRINTVAILSFWSVSLLLCECVYVSVSGSLCVCIFLFNHFSLFPILLLSLQISFRTLIWSQLLSLSSGIIGQSSQYSISPPMPPLTFLSSSNEVWVSATSPEWCVLASLCPSSDNGNVGGRGNKKSSCLLLEQQQGFSFIATSGTRTKNSDKKSLL